MSDDAREPHGRVASGVAEQDLKPSDEGHQTSKLQNKSLNRPDDIRSHERTTHAQHGPGPAGDAPRSWGR
jgi:hypothetical protein